MPKKMTAIEQLAKIYKTPKQVQTYLRTLPYNREKNGETLRSAMAVAHKKTAHCFEAAFFAAAILELNGYQPLVLSFESQDGLDHVIFVYKTKTGWGSVARSRDEGLHGRKPIFKSLKSLAMSYYEPYIDHSGRITGYQLAHLDDTKSPWRDSKKNVWKAEQYLIDLKHRPLKTSKARYKRILKSFLKNGPILSGFGWL